MPIYKTKHTILFKHQRIKNLDDLLSAIFWKEKEGRRKYCAKQVIKIIKKKGSATSKDIFSTINSEKMKSYMYETLHALKALEIIRRENGMYMFSRGFHNQLQYIMDTLMDEGILPTR